MKGRLLFPLRLSTELVQLWNRFRESNPIYASPFYAPEFTEAVAREREDARVAVFEQGTQVVGFLPLHLTRGGVGKPIGGHLNDYHGPILAPGCTMSPDLLVETAGISAYDYNHLPTGLKALTSNAHRFSSSPQMDLSAGYEACMADRGSAWSHARREMRRRWRKTEAEVGPVRFTFHEKSDAVFAQHVEMKNTLYERLGGQGVFGTGWDGRVIDRIRASESPDFAPVFSTLHAGDRLLAAHFGMRSASVLHWWFPSYDVTLSKLGPGIALVNECAQAAEGHGLSLIDFGRGDNEFKRLFANREVELSEGSMVRRGSLAGFVRKASQAAIALAERLPLGKYESYPSRTVAKFISGVALP